MADRRKALRSYWNAFTEAGGCAWCVNTRRLTLDRAVGEVVCPFCRDGQ